MSVRPSVPEFKSELCLVSESELKTEQTVEWRTGPELESKAGPELNGTRVDNQCEDGIKIKTVNKIGIENDTGT
ncbi:hypothetical protein EVAR_62438_1 [Eumeta japonica]|uniref:Uncharacterized protein n=1 Tax=Eumeta variegata TaxID=151549 RepID=A0A4C1Z8J1_EUMVA|nr:hypothetical protein EVAR_62438_1 [Eumeta japonica]